MGLRGFLYFRDQVDPLTVQAVLEDFANRMNKVENPADFRQLFLDPVEQTYRNVRAKVLRSRRIFSAFEAVSNSSVTNYAACPSGEITD